MTPRLRRFKNKYDADPEIAPADQVVPTFGDAPLILRQLCRMVLRVSSEETREYGDRIVFETENQIMDLGNAQDLMDKPVSDLNITAIKSEVTVTPDGEFVVAGRCV